MNSGLLHQSSTENQKSTHNEVPPVRYRKDKFCTDSESPMGGGLVIGKSGPHYHNHSRFQQITF